MLQYTKKMLFQIFYLQQSVYNYFISRSIPFNIFHLFLKLIISLLR